MIGANEEIVATDGTQVLVSPAHDSSSLALCLHEEADTRTFVHAADAVSRGHKKIIICTVDTDNVVPAVYVVQQLGVDELWQNFGVSKHQKYITSHLLTQAIGSRKSKYLSSVCQPLLSLAMVTCLGNFEQLCTAPEKPSTAC